MQTNPFKISGIVTGEYFIDRADELRAVIEVMQGQGEKMLIYGQRRMRKSSILLNAAARLKKSKGKVVYADISPATSLTDVANIILNAFNQQPRNHRRSLMMAGEKGVGKTYALDSFGVEKVSDRKLVEVVSVRQPAYK